MSGQYSFSGFMLEPNAVVTATREAGVRLKVVHLLTADAGGTFMST